MGVVLAAGGAYLGPWFGSHNGLGIRIAALAALVFSGALVFFAMAHATGAARLRTIIAAIGR